MFCLTVLSSSVALALEPATGPETARAAVSARAGGPKTLQRVEVIAQESGNAERQSAPAQVIVIAEEEIERFGDATIGDVLRRLPGMTFTGPAGVAKDVRMRGLDKGYTAFYINGEPLPAAKQERQIQVDRFPADMIERIEIIRNPGATLDGAGVAGSINIVLKQNVDNSKRVRVAMGRNGDLDTGDVVGQWSHKGEALDVLLTLSHARGAEDVIEEKRRYNADGSLRDREHKPKPVEKTETMFAPQISWRLGSGTLRVEPFVSDGTEDKREHLSAYDKNDQLSKRTLVSEEKTDRISRFASRYDDTADWGSWQLKAGVQQGRDDKDKLQQEQASNGTAGKRSQEIERVEDEQLYAGARVQLPLAAHQLEFGFEWRDSDYDKHKRVLEAARPDLPLQAKAPGANDIYRISETREIIYLQDQWQLAEGHTLTPGWRGQWISRHAVDRTGLARDNEQNSGDASLHYLWALRSDTNLRASFAETTRLAKFDDLNPLVTRATGANAGTLINPDKGGNADLRPEQADGFELGVEHFFAGKDAVFGINLYRRDVSDFIEKSARQEGARFVERPQNVGDAEFEGAEFDLRWPLVKNPARELLLSFSHAEMRGRVRNLKTGRYGDVKDLAPRVTQLGLDWQHFPSRWLAGVAFNYLPTFTSDGSNPEGVREIKRRQSSVLMDLYVGRRISDYGELRLLAKNLLAVEKDESTIKYKSNGSFDTAEDKIERSEPTITLSFDARF